MSQRRHARRGSTARRRARRSPAVQWRLAALGVGGALVLAVAVPVNVGSWGGGPLTPERVVRAEREAEPVRFTVSVSGDLLIHTAVWERALVLGGGRRYEFAGELREVKHYVQGADLAICHMETPMTPAPPASYPIFNTPPALADAIAATRWDACDTASNHSLDQGQAGVDATGRALDRAGVDHTGSFPSAAARRKPLILNRHGVRVAFLAYTTDTNGIPLPHPWSVNVAGRRRILADARRARRRGADAVIVNLHWGGEIVPEYQAQPSPGQLALVRRLTASPLITAIVGQGPHAVQPIERINGKFVVFSEGNLISNQSPLAGLPASSQDGMVVLLDCVAHGRGVRVADVRYVPVFVSHPDYTVLPIGRALAKGEGDTATLRASYRRTVSVVGRGRRIEPVPENVPGP
jgi:poly-gamma-glutamate synthesis protein (capsule biosynthesis protein)